MAADIANRQKTSLLSIAGTVDAWKGNFIVFYEYNLVLWHRNRNQKEMIIVTKIFHFKT